MQTAVVEGLLDHSTVVLRVHEREAALVEVFERTWVGFALTVRLVAAKQPWAAMFSSRFDPEMIR